MHKHTTHASAAVLRKHNILVDLHMQIDRQLVARSQTQKLDIQTSQTQPSCENNTVFYSDKMGGTIFECSSAWPVALLQAVTGDPHVINVDRICDLSDGGTWWHCGKNAGL